MDDLIQLLIGAAPVLGGLVLGVVAMNFLKSPDVRGPVKDDLDLLDRLPAEQTHRRAELQRSIYLRIDDLVAHVDHEHAARVAANPYLDRWRGAVAFLFTVLFTYVWWGVDHSRPDWLPMLLVLIVLSVLAFTYTASGVLRATRAYRRGRRNLDRSAG